MVSDASRECDQGLYSPIMHPPLVLVQVQSETCPALYLCHPQTCRHTLHQPRSGLQLSLQPRTLQREILPLYYAPPSQNHWRPSLRTITLNVRGFSNISLGTIQKIRWIFSKIPRPSNGSRMSPWVPHRSLACPQAGPCVRV